MSVNHTVKTIMPIGPRAGNTKLSNGKLPGLYSDYIKETSWLSSYSNKYQGLGFTSARRFMNPIYTSVNNNRIKYIDVFIPGFSISIANREFRLCAQNPGPGIYPIAE
jgi:hypothetical protein